MEGFGKEVIFLIFIVFLFLLPFIIRYFKKGAETVTDFNDENIKEVRDMVRNESEQHQEEIEDANLSIKRPRNFKRYYQDRQCPICLNNANYAIETNCGHMFCGKCILLYWRNGNWGTSPLSCPVCRQTVTLIIPCFPRRVTSNDDKEKQYIIDEINVYNKRFSDAPRSMVDYIRDLPVLLRHAISDFFSVSGIRLVFRFRLVLCFIIGAFYLLSPLDIIPEALFGIFGLLDDAIVVLLMALYASVSYRNSLTSTPDDNSSPGTYNIEDEPSTSSNYGNSRLYRNFQNFRGPNLLNEHLLRRIGASSHNPMGGDNFNRYLFGDAQSNQFDTNNMSNSGNNPSNTIIQWLWRTLANNFLNNPNTFN